MTFDVTITEELSRTVKLEAESEDEAYSKAKEMYRNEEIVLTAEDSCGVEIEVTAFR